MTPPRLHPALVEKRFKIEAVGGRIPEYWVMDSVTGLRMATCHNRENSEVVASALNISMDLAEQLPLLDRILAAARRNADGSQGA